MSSLDGHHRDMASSPSASRTRPEDARRERLRRAKHAQRERDREAGLVACQVKLPAPTARRLRGALAIPGFEAILAGFLDDSVVDTEAYPSLRALCWSRAGRYVTTRDAFALYERNWRFVDHANLLERERELIRRLAEQFGGGVLNV
jgi:hypothetical protein